MEHVVIDAVNSTIRCNRCEEEKKLPLPMEIDKFVSWSKAFRTLHKYCGGEDGRMDRKVLDSDLEQ